MNKPTVLNKPNVTIVLVGLLMATLLMFEFDQNKTLITNNRALMHDTVLKSLRAQIDVPLAELPTSMAAIERHWQSLTIDARVIYQGDMVYPYPFKGNQNKAVSGLWQTYAQRANDGDRIRALAKIAQALEDNNDAQTAKASRQYFSLVENFKLSPLEEVISALAFLQLGQKARWNKTLTRQILLDGTPSLRPVSYYLFRHNEGFSAGDLSLAINIIQANLEATNIDSAWFAHNARYLKQQPKADSFSTLTDFAIVNHNQVYRQLGNQMGLLLQFDLPRLLSQVENTLKQQGILAQADKIYSQNNHQTDNVSVLKFTIERQAWTSQTQRQQWFFAIKLGLLLVFVMALLLTSKIIHQRREKEQQTIYLREQFINLVSHELKTPLAAIRIMTETLDKRATRQLSLKNYPARIVGEVDRLWLMVDNLLSFNRIRSGQMQLQLATTNLNQLLSRVCDKFEDQQLTNQLPETLCQTVDPMLFELVISNLISNGLKYNDQPQATIAFSYSNEQQAIYVKDNGIGINKAHWHKVFNEFYRIEQNQSQSGTGVGLSLCKLIMQLHQGDITIVESSSAGTLWQITFLPQ